MRSRRTTSNDDLAQFVEGYATSPNVVALAMLYFTNAEVKQLSSVARPTKREVELPHQLPRTVPWMRRGSKRWDSLMKL